MKKKAEYPIVDGHRRHFVHYPVQGLDGKWRAADVCLPSGYVNPEKNPGRVPFDTEAECQRGCDIHNNYHGWPKKQVNDIVTKSMGINI